ncbi:MAG: RNA polymerase sigma factor [Verrucomicrobiales bacterium]|jgi:DNA-directed RNA polymerase specialized sigma24 family protein
MNETSDKELLAAYAKWQDEAAFAQLLEKYAGMVYGTAKRQTSNVEAAREITQTSFAPIATKAERLIYHTSIGAWLHRATVLESKKHLRTEQRHLRKMKALSEHFQTMAPDQEWERLGLCLMTRSKGCRRRIWRLWSYVSSKT